MLLPAYWLLPDLRWMTGTLLLGVVLGGVVSVIAFASRKRRAAELTEVTDVQALTPLALELHVAQVLATLPGWSAYPTPGSGDQGADVIATLPNGQKLAVQVKHQRKNVNHGAAQEIVASKAFYNCTLAAVVTSGPGFTASARELARANGVALWDTGTLREFQRLAAAGQVPPARLLSS